MLAVLTESDLRGRYGRGPWQLAKWLVDPFALVGIYVLLVTFILRRPGEAPALRLACAVIPFQLVMMTVVNSMGAVQLRGSIIRNMAFNRVLIPVSSTLTEAVAFAASLVLFAILMAVYGVSPTIGILWLPVAIAATLAFSVACAYVASLIGVWFRDLRPFVISFVRAMFFLAPGLVAIRDIGGGGDAGEAEPAHRTVRVVPFGAARRADAPLGVRVSACLGRGVPARGTASLSP